MKKTILFFLTLCSMVVNAQYWTEKAAGFATGNSNSKIHTISIVDANVIWAVTNNGRYYTKSLDGGNTWTSGYIDLGGDTTLNIGNISAYSNNIAWVSAFGPPLNPLQGIWKTVDGGTTWQRQATAHFNSTPDSFVAFVHFFGNGLTGICVGDAKTGENFFEAYETSDGGTTWNGPVNFPIKLADEYTNVNSFVFYGQETIWFSTTKGRLFKSINNGSDWTAYETPAIGNISQKFSFSDANKGLLISPIGHLYKTINGGLNWTFIPDNGYKKGAISYVPNTSYVVSTGSGGSAYSTDDGTTWNVIDNIVHGKAFFMNMNVGFSSGTYISPTDGGIFKYSSTPLSVEKFDTTNIISAYPNPTNGILHLNSENSPIREATIFDLLGRQVYNSKFSALNKVDLDLKSLQSGSYLLKVTSDSGKTETMKIMKN